MNPEDIAEMRKREIAADMWAFYNIGDPPATGFPVGHDPKSEEI